MSGEVFDVKHSSSVHLQGLGKLVSAFRASDNEQDLRLQASDGVASQAMYSKSKDRRLALSNFTGNNTRLEPIQNVPFEERLNGNTSEENKKGKLCLDFTSTFGTDHVDTQHTKNSLYLINELCDRFTAGTSQSNNRYNDYLGTETTLVALNTPSTSTTQRLSYPEAHKQIVLSAPSTFSSNYGSYNDQQPPSPLYTSALQNTLQQSRLCEQNGGEGECAVLSTENASFSRKNNGQDYLAEGNQSLGSSQPTGAISHMQQMLEQLTPPPERIPGKQASADPIGQLSRDDVLQCTSLEGRDTGKVKAESLIY